MFDTLKRWLSPPTLDDMVEQRKVTTLNTLFILSFIGAILVAVFGFLNNETVTWRLFSGATVIILVAYALMKRGYIALTSWLIPAVFYLPITYLIINANGLHDEAMYGFAAVIILAGIILDKRGVMLFTSLVTITIAVIGFSETRGILENSFSESTSVATIIIIEITTILTGTLIYVLVNDLTKSLGDVRENAEVLRELSQSLEVKVAERTRALTASAEVSRSLSNILDLKQPYNQIVAQVQEAFDYYHVHLFLFDAIKKNLVLVGATGNAGRELLAMEYKQARNEGAVGRAAATNKPVFVPDVAQDANWYANRHLQDTRAEIAVPITVGNQVLGVLDVQHNALGYLTQEHVDLLQSIANQVAIAVQNTQQYQQTQSALNETQRQASRLATLNKLSNALNLAMTLDDVYRAAIQSISEIFPSDRLSIALLDPSMESVEVLVLEDYDKDLKSSTHLPLANTTIGTAIKSKQLVRLPNDAPLMNYTDSRKLAQGGFQSVLVVPLNARGQIIGTLNLGSKAEHTYQDTDISYIQQIVSLLAIMIETRRLDERSRLLAGIVENHPDFIGVGSLEGRAIYLNPAGRELAGIVANQDIANLNAADFYEVDEAKKLVDDIIPVAMEQGSWSGEAYLLKQDKTIIPVQQTIGVNYDTVGNPVSFSITMHDVTKQKQSEQAQIKRATELQTVAEVGTLAASLRDTQELLQVVADLTKERFNLYHAHIYLVDEANQELVLKAGAGEVGRKMVTEGRRISLKEGRSLVAKAANTHHGVHVSDVRQEPDFLPNPLLPDTRSELAVPMIAGEQVLGVLDVQSAELAYFTDEDVSIQMTLAAQVAAALQNASQFEQTQTALEEVQALQRAMSREGWQAFMTAAKLPVHGYVASADKLTPILPDKQDFLEGVSILAPVNVGETMIGRLGIRSAPDQPVSEDTKALLQSISLQVGQALERARLSEQTTMALSETEEQARRLALLNEFSLSLNQATTLDQVYQIATNRIPGMLAVDRVSLPMLNKTGDSLRIEAIYGEEIEMPVGMVVPLAGTPMEQALNEGKIVRATTDDLIKTVLIAPLSAGTQPIGCLVVGRRRAEEFSDNAQNFILQLASVLSAAITNNRLLAETQARAERERRVRDITDKIRRGGDTATILQVARQEIAQMLGASKASIRLGNKLPIPPGNDAPLSEAKTNGDHAN